MLPKPAESLYINSQFYSWQMAIEISCEKEALCIPKALCDECAFEEYANCLHIRSLFTQQRGRKLR
ncbi:hypothetical protein M514_05915 [Trichuris suis]|uniref:Uncharacterized protein n=1 Tax=Trichuris suis TaxID=68888 RepID=A0A085N7Y8_9BILA|nr:hypothetical protein M513_05915 [Trichuris suis]KFD65584.1 hypothetical protein M514_05915 [Trichuris suis]